MYTELLIAIPMFFIVINIAVIIELLVLQRKQANDTTIANNDVKTTAQRHFTTCDFKDSEYRNAWIAEFNQGYSARDIESYLELASDNNFAIHGKECCDFWNAMIKECKPGSPSSIRYYDGLHVRGKYMTDAELKAASKPTYQYYNGRGYGKLKYHHNGYTSWLNSHYAKYPNGQLPIQSMTVQKVKQLDILKEANKIVKLKGTRTIKKTVKRSNKVLVEVK